jgi:hypothetical protein
MNLYIETDNAGNTINHPALEENLIQAFGSIPSHWEPFVRIAKPILGVYQVLDSQEPTYQKLDGVWQDVWSLKSMTNEEKMAKQQSVKDIWNSSPLVSNFSTWSFNEETCEYDPPIPYPVDGQTYYWQGSTNSWKVMPPYPVDDKFYTFNITTGQWELFE